MHRTTLLTAILFVTVTLAGCADGSDGPTELTGEETVDKNEFQFSSGKGAIAGLLVDDRFRPIDLEADGASGEFQAAGFILVQETGQQLRTNENGEFNVLDLDPGTYTLRTSAEGYEAVPQKVQVTEGEFAETNIVARRKVSNDGTILSNEYSVFVPCAVSVPASTVVLDCLNDNSGDSYRPGFTTDFQVYPDTTVIITEFLSKNDAGTASGALKLVFREAGDGQYYSQGFITEGNYMRFYNEVGVVSEFDTEDRVVPFENDRATETIMFPQGGFKSETQTVIMDPVFGGAESRGLGAQVGVQAQILQTWFLGPPEIDAVNFCALC